MRFSLVVLVGVSTILVTPVSADAAVTRSSRDGKTSLLVVRRGVRGVVYNKSGSPVASATVSIRSRSAGEKTFTMVTTNSKGEFDIKCAARTGHIVDVVIVWNEKLKRGTVKRRITGIKVRLR